MYTYPILTNEIIEFQVLLYTYVTGQSSLWHKAIEPTNQILYIAVVKPGSQYDAKLCVALRVLNCENDALILMPSDAT